MEKEKGFAFYLEGLFSLLVLSSIIVIINLSLESLNRTKVTIEEEQQALYILTKEMEETLSSPQYGMVEEYWQNDKKISKSWGLVDNNLWLLKIEITWTSSTGCQRELYLQRFLTED